MYAVVRTGGKQYRLGVGDSIKVGTPLVPGASVKAEIVGHGRNKKITVFKMKRRKQYRRTQGHRQAFTQLKVTEINA